MTGVSSACSCGVEYPLGMLIYMSLPEPDTTVGSASGRVEAYIVQDIIIWRRTLPREVSDRTSV